MLKFYSFLMSQTARLHMMLALEVLNACDGFDGAKIAPRDVEILKSYLGNDADGLTAADEIACEVIERGMKELKAARGS